MSNQRTSIAICVFSILCTIIAGSIGSQTDALLERIDALEKRGQQQTEKIQSMESRLCEQDQRLADQETTINDYRHRLLDQDKKIAVHERAISDYKQKLEEQDQRLAVQESAVSEYKQRLEKQDNQLTAQDEVISDYKHVLKEQDNKVSIQERTIRGYKQRITDLEQTVDVLKHKQDSDVDDDSVKMRSGNYRNPGSTMKNVFVKSKHGTTSERTKRALLNAESPVAFHAVIKAGVEVTHLGINQKIVFPDVIANIGGAYQRQHGIFAAPRPGIYIFSTSVMSDYRGHVEIAVSLMKNGQVLARAFAHGDSAHQDQGSVTVVTQLELGDQVWVSNYNMVDTSLWGDYYDSFMGCLVVPL